jgi:hypothetical protein
MKKTVKKPLKRTTAKTHVVTRVRKRVRRQAKLAVVPHKENGFRPHLVRWYGVLLLFLVIGGLFGTNYLKTGTVLGNEAPIIAEDLLVDTNKERASNALRELLSVGQYKLIDRSLGKPGDYERDRVVGWFDAAGVYLVPAVAFAAVKRLLGPQALLISPQTLYGQMEQLGWLAGTGSGSVTKVISVGSEKVRVLHWRPNVLDTAGDASQDSDDGEAVLGL